MIQFISRNIIRVPDTLGLFKIPFAAILLLLLLGGVSLLYPFGRDQGEYAMIAMEVRRGKVDYRDIFDIKPPLTHMAHGLALSIFGQSMLAIRLFDLIWQCITVVLLVILAESIFKKRLLGLVAAFLYITGYYSFGYWNTAQTDGFLTLLILLSLLAYIHYKKRGRMWLIVSCGLAIGTAMLFKYPIGILLLFLLMMIFYDYRSDGYKAAISLVIGCVVPIAIFLLVLVIQGALSDFMFTQITYIPAYNVRIGSQINVFIGILQFLLATPIMLLLFGSMIAFVALSKRRRLEYSALVSLWWLAALVHLAIQNKFYFYHGLPLLAPGAVMASYVICMIYEKTYTKVPRFIFLSVATFTILSASVLPWFLVNQKILIDLVTENFKLQNVYTQFGDYESGDYSVQADFEVAAYLKSHTGQSDKLFIWGFEPTIYFLAELSSASRFLYNFPLYGAFGWLEFRDQLVADLEQNEPKYIVIVQNDAIPWVTGTNNDSLAAFLDFQELRNLVSEHYMFETQIEDFYLYRLNDSSSGG